MFTTINHFTVVLRFILSLLASCALVGLLSTCQTKSTTLFQRLPSAQTGITFANQITPNDTLNILKFEYVYNGGGTAIADFNNDGLQDIFFTGNQVPSKLYLNKGNLKFEDVSQLAGIDTKKRWCAGVTTVDINADGWMDVYISTTVYGNAADRRNLLFINQGKQPNGQPKFKEMADAYGLADDGHGQQAAFFDYDNDGDLDVYLLINKITQFPNQYRPKITDGSNPNTDRLYRNDWNETLKHPVFTNVSAAAGITIEGYGLGLTITDINQDGWKDIYVTNDYAADDLLYINNKNGTFTDQAAAYFKHTSNSAMGNDVADISNDGLPDLVAVDMAPATNERKKTLAPATNYQLFNFSDMYGYIYQYMRNTLQLHQGFHPETKQPIFSEISLLAGVQETDWSWSPSLADFDNDGYRDLLVTNGFPLDVTDRDFMAYRTNVNFIADPKDLLPLIPEVKISNYAFRNTGNLTFENVTNQWGMEIPSFSNGASYGDLDNDGDLDYIVNNINDEAFIYKNTQIDQKLPNNYLRLKFSSPTNPFGMGVVAKAKLPNGQQLYTENNVTRGYLSAVEPQVHWGLGNAPEVAELTVIWPSGLSQTLQHVKANQQLVVEEKNATVAYQYPTPTFTDLLFKTDTTLLKFTHQEHDFVDFNIQNLLPFKLSQMGPALAAADVNADGLDDVLIGGSKDFATSLLLQTPQGHWKPAAFAKDSLTKNSEDTGILLFDADNDNDADAYIVSGSNEDYPDAASFQDKIYLNDGRGNFTYASNALPAMLQSGSCVRAADYDKDGDLDLLVVGRQIPLSYPQAASSYLLRNDSTPQQVKFTDVTPQSAPLLQNIGVVVDALWTDFDNDSQLDILLAGEWMPPTFLRNTNGKFALQTTGLEAAKGLWSSIAAADFDNDGDMDYILGNLGLNAQVKASEAEPFTIFSGDLDKNGNFDLFPFIYYPTISGKRQQVPFAGRDDVNKQYNPIRARFTTYKDFTKATPETLLTSDERQVATQVSVTHLASSYLENKGKGQFTLHTLPTQAQLAPINGMVVQDYNADGYLDVLLVGNNFGNEISIGRYDALNGLLLFGTGGASFRPSLSSGFYVGGDAKALVTVSNAKNNLLLLASQNRGKIVLHQATQTFQNKALKPLTNRISYRVNGRQLTQEMPYGMSYLSQSSRRAFLPTTATHFAEY